MILFIMVLAAIAFFMSFIYIDRRLLRTALTLLSGLVLVLSLLGIVTNYHDHFGLTKVTRHQRSSIYSVLGRKMPANVILYQPIGKAGNENVYIYAKKADQKKPNHTQADTKTTNRVTRISTNQAYLINSETHWEYRSSLARLFFGIAGNGHELVSRANHFYLPKAWLRLSSAQIKALQKRTASASFKKQAQQQAAVYVREHMAAAIASQPSLASDPQAQARMGKQFAADFQAQLIRRTVADLKK